MKTVKRILIALLIIVLLGAAALGIREAAEYLNTDILSYDGRTYTKSSLEVDADTLEIIHTLDDTGVKVKGMEVFDDLDNPYASTVIYLKTQDDTFLEYVLSGGP